MGPGKLVLLSLLVGIVALTIWNLAAGLPSDYRVRARVELVDKDIPRDLIHERGTRLPDGRLISETAVEFEGGGGVFQRCYFDASVSIENGRVRWIVAGDAEGRVKHGDPVENISPGALEVGEPTVSFPVHFADDGTLQYGSEHCDEREM
jgi:hypothetical protein